MSDDDWLEVNVGCAQEQLETLEAWLFESGALAVTLADGLRDEDLSHAVLEPVPGEVRLWQQITLTGLFAREVTPEQLQTALQSAASFHGIALPHYAITPLADQEWARAWMDTFHPMQFGQRFWICPTGAVAPDENAINLRLDPGMAFGTGTHATTAQCLEWLGAQTAQSLQPLQGRRVIDYGCGSGVLAIAALLLGASSACAVDIDEQALSATRTNSVQNSVDDRITVGMPDLVNNLQADIVLANILFQPLMTLAEKLARAVVPGGSLVLAGMLEDQIEPLHMRYNEYFEFKPGRARDGWALMTAIRR